MSKTVFQVSLKRAIMIADLQRYDRGEFLIETICRLAKILETQHSNLSYESLNVFLYRVNENGAVVPKSKKKFKSVLRPIADLLNVPEELIYQEVDKEDFVSGRPKTYEEC